MSHFPPVLILAVNSLCVYLKVMPGKIERVQGQGLERDPKGRRIVEHIIQESREKKMQDKKMQGRKGGKKEETIGKERGKQN